MIDDRDFAAHHGLPEFVTCDRCQNATAALSYVLWGSPRGILESADDAGVLVARRQDLAAVDRFTAIPREVLSSRVFHVCGNCGEQLGVNDGAVLVEPGYEEAYERWMHQREDEA